MWTAATGASCSVLLLCFHLGLWQHSLLKPMVGVIHVSVQSLSQNYCRQSGDFCDMGYSFLGSKKMQLNSFQVTTTLAFVLEVLSFENIRCLKEESLSQGRQRSEPDLINQHFTWLSLLHIQHMYFACFWLLPELHTLLKDLKTAIFLTVAMKLISCRCWPEAGSILHFQA